MQFCLHKTRKYFMIEMKINDFGVTADIIILLMQRTGSGKVWV